MPMIGLDLRRLGVAAAGMMLAVGVATGGASAGGLRDRVYADSFNNLVIYSPSGYKRIVVGRGELAREFAAYSAGGDPDVVYLEPQGHAVAPSPCRRAPGIVHGRSYMYGLPDGVVPVIGVCE